jgi:voltage-gated potassium channel
VAAAQGQRSVWRGGHLPESSNAPRRTVIWSWKATPRSGRLLAAGVERAAGLVATIDDGLQRLCRPLARTQRRLFIVGWANAGCQSAAQAGWSRCVVSPYTMAGHRIAELAVRPAVSDYIDAALSRAHLSFSIEEYRVVSGGPLDGTRVGDLLERGIFTLAVVRGPGEYDAHPPPERRLQAGEELILSGSSDTIRTLVAPD